MDPLRQGQQKILKLHGCWQISDILAIICIFSYFSSTNCLFEPSLEIVNLNLYASLKEVGDVFWGKRSPESSQGNSLDCAILALQEDSQLVWKDVACGWVSQKC